MIIANESPAIAAYSISVNLIIFHSQIFNNATHDIILLTIHYDEQLRTVENKQKNSKKKPKFIVGNSANNKLNVSIANKVLHVSVFKLSITADNKGNYAM